MAPEQWLGLYKPLWLGAALLNSSYSYYWDIERDWDIQWFTAPGVRRLLMLLTCWGFLQSSFGCQVCLL